jgi:hypothetical protein
MPCPVCSLPLGHDHRACMIHLFREGAIQSLSEWTAMMTDKPRTIRKGRVRAILPKEDPPSS